MESISPGLSAVSVYVPPYRVDLEQWSLWTGNPWDKVRSVVGHSFRIPGPDEDMYTMAANAVARLIEDNDIDPQQVGYLALGTESSMDNAVGAVIVRGLVDRVLASRGLPPLARDCEVPEFKQACLAGLYGMKGAQRYLAYDGIGRQAIVVASDIAEYARGSSGEQTQGAGAVAMLFECQARLLTLDLKGAGNASSFRGLDFRKPFARFCAQGLPDNGRLRDFPVFNGKYSTACYLDETLNALDALLEKRGGPRARWIQSLEAVFMHRPYHRMPAAAWTLAYLFALGRDGGAAHAELETYCSRAGQSLAGVLAEMEGLTRRADAGDFDESLAEPFPKTAAIAKAFRDSPAYAAVDRKLALGADAMMEMGNLYSGALPAWIGAGMDEAARAGRDLTGRELLLIGYGSGDAAEAIPAFPVEGWEAPARRIDILGALSSPVDLDRATYEAFHDGVAPLNSPTPGSAVRISAIGRRAEGPIQDFGVARYQVVDGG